LAAVPLLVGIAISYITAKGFAAGAFQAHRDLGDKTVALLSADLLRVGVAAAVEAEAIGCC
jgi:hypothetical protein